MSVAVKTHKRERVNVTLPPQTLRLLDRITGKGDRSHFIDEAVKFYVQKLGQANLRKHIKEGAIKRAERDFHLAGEWFAIENELEDKESTIWQGRKRQ